jgi:hypothetical protein
MPEKEPQVLYISNPDHVASAAQAMLQLDPVVVDYGSTFGTAFIPSAREKIALLRQEHAPLATVSIVSDHATTLSWIDYTRLHPHLAENIQNGALRILYNIAFLRLPANPISTTHLAPHHLNQDMEFQTFIVPDSDPLLSSLKLHGHTYYSVRSSNVTGSPEEFEVEGAGRYATAIGAPYLVLLNPDKPKTQFSRKRLGSQPILHLPSDRETPQVILTRSGNTHPEALKTIVNHIFPQAEFSVKEEKQVSFRHPYHPASDGIGLEATAIISALLSASGLPENTLK